MDIKCENSESFQAIVEPVSRSPPPPQRRIKKSYRKKVEKEWSHEDIQKLIKEIEMRRSLWDIGCPEYRLPKESVWQEVAEATNMTANNCKAKWANLRITFNVNLEKQRKNRLSQGTSKPIPIVWKYFRSMLFLQSNKGFQPTSFQLNSPIDDDCFSQTIKPVENSKRRKTNIIPFDSDTSQSRESNLKEMASETLQSLRSAATSNPKTPSALLCEYMASELDTLTPEQATLARLKMRRAFNDIMEEVLMPSSFQQEYSYSREVTIKNEDDYSLGESVTE